MIIKSHVLRFLVLSVSYFVLQISVFWIRIRIDFGRLDRLDPDPDPGGQKLPTKKGRAKKIIGLSAYVFFGGLEASPVVWTSFMEANLG